MNRKVIIYDIDGTLVDSPLQKLPSVQIVDKFKSLSDKGYTLCAATGRGWSYVKDILNSLDVDSPAIIAGGTQIVEPKSGNVLWQSSISIEDLDLILEILKSEVDIRGLINDYTEEDYLSGGFDFKVMPIPENVYFIEVSFIDDLLATQLIEKLSGIEGIVCTLVVSQRQGLKDLHITNIEATKEHAISELFKMLSINKDNAIGIGDGHNDIHLFKSVGYKVAMGNAVDELKSEADRVIGSVDEEGLLHYLSELD